jgi:hypothetical protein
MYNADLAKLHEMSVFYLMSLFLAPLESCRLVWSELDPPDSENTARDESLPQHIFDYFKSISDKHG